MTERSPSPLSEGEIASTDEEKAISSNTSKAQGSSVNKSARLSLESLSRAAQRKMHLLSTDPNFHFRDLDDDVRLSTARATSYRERSRSRSPWRADKPSSGEKRRRDDDHYHRKGGSDPRRFKVHYEDSGRGGRNAYIDPDRPAGSKGGSNYDGPRAHKNTSTYKHNGDSERSRDRSRSPFRHDRSDPNLHSSAHERDTSSRGQQSSSSTKSKQLGAAFESSPPHKQAANGAQHLQQTNGRDESQTEKYDEMVKPQLTEAELIEQRRKKREAIKAKHRSNAPLLVQALEQSMPSAPSTPLHDTSGTPSEQQSPPSSLGSPRTPHRDSPPGSPAAFAVNNDEELVERRNSDPSGAEEDGPSAAEYDPNLDMQEDRPDHKRQDLQAAAPEPVKQEQAEVGQGPKQSKEFDMFAEDDDDDMFAPVDSAAKPTRAKEARALDESLLDNWDYPDGHYRIILGELLDGRYAVQQQIGKGTFATVVRAQDSRTGNSVAVKIACNNDTMYKAGQKEMDMLQLLNENDPDDKKHVIRLLRHFDHKGHLCLVFENLSADLRDVLKKFGRNVGLNLKAIRSYGQQMFLALSHLKKCQILHADLKPDNILVSEKRSLLKICDLGTAAFANDAEITPYLVSRFYRAPEVILGMPFDYAIDMWSIGCTLFELYTGRILFAGADNNQMLRVIQECRGKFPVRMLKRSSLADKHFDIDGNFFSQERDKITGKATLRQMNFIKTAPGKDLRARLSGNTKGMKSEEIKEHAAFVDLMDKCLQLDPARRISPNEALRHTFIAHSTQGQTDKAAPAVKVAMNVPRRL